jgi:hypothetical protein
MNRVLITFLLAALMIQPGPATASNGLTGGIEFSDDSDGGHLYGIYAGYLHTFEESGSGIGFRTGLLNIKDPDGSERFRVLEANHQSRPVERMRLDLKGSWLNNDKWSPFLYSLNVANSPGDKWNLEVYGERGIVDSLPSVRLEYLIDTYGFSVDYAATGELTLVGALFRQDITDGNERLGRVGRIIYTPGAKDWLNLQVKVRIIGSDFDGIGYFSPATQSEYYLLVGAARPFADDNWLIKGLAGPGLQRIEDHGGGVEEKAASLAEVRLKGWFTQQFGLNVGLGCTTAQRSGSGSRYCHGDILFTYMP